MDSPDFPALVLQHQPGSICILHSGFLAAGGRERPAAERCRGAGGRSLWVPPGNARALLVAQRLCFGTLPGTAQVIRSELTKGLDCQPRTFSLGNCYLNSWWH